MNLMECFNTSDKIAITNIAAIVIAMLQINSNENIFISIILGVEKVSIHFLFF